MWYTMFICDMERVNLNFTNYISNISIYDINIVHSHFVRELF